MGLGLVGLELILGVYLGVQLSIKTQEERVYQIYHNLVIQTGQSNEIPPLIIDGGAILNAYTDGTKIVVFKGLIDFTNNEDEIALIIAHEMAHNTLRHISIQGHYADVLESQVSESNADKMGAFYMMKAGYSICKARNIWLRLRATDGDMLVADHPTDSYRYDQLNVNCQ